MPSSSSIFDNLAGNIIATAAPKTIVDIGAGAGKYGRIIRQIEKLCQLKIHATAVEIDETYIRDYKLHEIYDDIISIDATQLLRQIPGIKGDMCILGDFIEHLPKSDGIDLLNYLLYRFSIVITVVPVDMYQGDWMGHAQEAHISLWYVNDFTTFPKVSIVKRYEGETCFLLACMNGACSPSREQFVLLDERNKVSMGYPYRALHQIAVTDQ
ncbi:MAG: hypothetical protein KA164_08620 [Rhodoferax sp.]|jgi:hypothetical protein|nr:hypothetical protein [Rhodoferax sp.]